VNLGHLLWHFKHILAKVVLCQGEPDRRKCTTRHTRYTAGLQPPELSSCMQYCSGSPNRPLFVGRY